MEKLTIPFAVELDQDVGKMKPGLLLPRQQVAHQNSHGKQHVRGRLALLAPSNTDPGATSPTGQSPTSTPKPHKARKTEHNDTQAKAVHTEQ